MFALLHIKNRNDVWKTPVAMDIYYMQGGRAKVHRPCKDIKKNISLALVHYFFACGIRLFLQVLLMDLNVRISYLVKSNRIYSLCRANFFTNNSTRKMVHYRS